MKKKLICFSLFKALCFGAPLSYANFETFILEGFPTIWKSDEVRRDHEVLQQELKNAEQSTDALIVFRDQNKDLLGFRRYKEQDAKNVDGIDLSNLQVHSIEFIRPEHFKKVASLNVTNNKLSTFSIPKKFQLDRFFASDNQLTEIQGLESQVVLEELFLYNNALEKLILNQNTLLIIVDIHNNQLRKIDLGDHLSLKEVFLSNNKLSDVILDATAIETLDLSHNKLDDINLKIRGYLSSLSLADNCFKKLNLSNARISENLKRFSISDNQALEEITLYEKIYCGIDKLENIPSLKKIIITPENWFEPDSRWEKKRLLHLGLFLKFKEPFLAELKMEEKQEAHCTLFSGDSIQKRLQNILPEPSLRSKTVIASNNPEIVNALKEKILEEKIPAIYVINDQNGYVFSLYGKEELKDLNEIDLSNGTISNLGFLNEDGFSQLTKINISFNKLKKIPNLEKFNNITHLNISYNIFEESISLPDHVLSIDVSNNKIKEIKNLDSLKRLKILDASKNEIRNEFFISLENIEEIKLSDNFLIKFVLNSKNINNLRSIDLKNNLLMGVNLPPVLLQEDVQVFLQGNLQLREALPQGFKDKEGVIQNNNNGLSHLSESILYFNKIYLDKINNYIKSSIYFEEKNLLPSSFGVNQEIMPHFDVLKTLISGFFDLFQESKKRETLDLMESKEEKRKQKKSIEAMNFFRRVFNDPNKQMINSLDVISSSQEICNILWAQQSDGNLIFKNDPLFEILQDWPYQAVVAERISDACEIFKNIENKKRSACISEVTSQTYKKSYVSEKIHSYLSEKTQNSEKKRDQTGREAKVEALLSYVYEGLLGESKQTVQGISNEWHLMDLLFGRREIWSRIIDPNPGVAGKFLTMHAHLIKYIQIDELDPEKNSKVLQIEKDLRLDRFSFLKDLEYMARANNPFGVDPLETRPNGRCEAGLLTQLSDMIFQRIVAEEIGSRDEFRVKNLFQTEAECEK